jgi:hypothetical protein
MRERKNSLTVDPPLGSEALLPDSPSPKESDSPLKRPGHDCLEESLVLLHQSIEEARNVNISECLEEAAKGKKVDTPRDDKDTTWLLNVFNRLQNQHETEKVAWEKNLKSEKHRKSAYKSQLKDEYKKRLKWLEQQLENAETGQCCAEGSDRAHAGNPSIPCISRVSTGLTQSSSSSDVDENHRRVLSPKQGQILSPTQGQDGYEVAFQTSDALQKVQRLEKRLRDTVRDHENERALWLRTLDEAALVTETGEQLSAQQEMQFGELRTQLSQNQHTQRQKFKQQIRVLKELLDLTEQQLVNERNGWEGELKVFEVTCERLVAEKVELQDEVSKAQTELTEVKRQLKEASTGKDEWKHEKEAFEKTVSQLIADKSQLSKKINTRQFHIQAAPSEDNRTQGSPGSANFPLSPRRRVEWDDKLDRAMVERDLYQQEARQAKDRLEAERREWEAKLEEMTKSERKEASVRLEKIKQGKEQLDVKENERVQAVNALDKERQKFREQLEESYQEWEREASRQILELQDMHAAEMRELEDPESELFEKYKNAIESRNNIVLKLRGVEQQRSEDKCNWKLQLEGALAESRRYMERIKEIEEHLEQERQSHEQETEALRKRLASDRVDFSRQISEMTVHKSLSNSQANRDIQERLEAAQEVVECKLALVMETHSKELQHLKGELAAVKSRNVFVKGELEMQKKKFAHIFEENKDHKLALEREAAELVMTRQRHEREVKAWSVQLEESKEEVHVWMGRSTDIESRLRDVSEAKGKEWQEWGSKLKDSEAKNRILTDKTNDAQKRLNDASEAKAKIETEALDLASQLDASKTEVHALTSKLDEAKTQVRVLSDRTNAMEKLLEDASEVKEKHGREAQEWSKQLEEARAEVRFLTKKTSDMEKRLQIALEEGEKYSKEALSLATKLEESQEEVRDLRNKTKDLEVVAKIEKKHKHEISEWKSNLKESQGDALDLADRLSSLTEQHNTSKKRLEIQIERLKSERDRYKLDQESFETERDRFLDSVVDESLSKQNVVVCNSIEELRKDVVAIRDSMECSARTDKVIDGANFDALRTDLHQIHASLDDVVAELTLETEAMYETRNAVKSLTKEPTSSGQQDTSLFVEMQEKLFAEVGALRESFKNIAESPKKGRHLNLAAEIQRKEIALAKCGAELEILRDELIGEVAKRTRAEAEVATLNDQSDAYTEELMHLQAENARLESTLTEAECKMTEVLLGRACEVDPESVCDIEESESNVSQDDDSSPLLEEALALAQGLTEIVQGRDDDGKQANIFQIMQSLSQMMDDHEQEYEQEDQPQRQIPRSHRITKTPDSRLESVHESLSSESTIQVVVEQLYTRCQLLERERLEMMNSTLDLLESSRHASKVDLEAALAIARRKAGEELIHMRKQNHVDREQLYHKLCSRVTKDDAISKDS